MTHWAAPDSWDVKIKPMDAAMFEGDQPSDFGLRLLQVSFPAHDLPELTRRLREHAAGRLPARVPAHGTAPGTTTRPPRPLCCHRMGRPARTSRLPARPTGRPTGQGRQVAVRPEHPQRGGPRQGTRPCLAPFRLPSPSLPSVPKRARARERGRPTGRYSLSGLRQCGPERGRQEQAVSRVSSSRATCGTPLDLVARPGHLRRPYGGLSRPSMHRRDSCTLLYELGERGARRGAE